MNYLYLGLGFVVIIIIQFLLNFSKYLYLKKAINMQDVLIEGVQKDASEDKAKAAEKATDWIEENQIEIKKVVLRTGINDQTKFYMAPLGYGYTREKGISALDNLAFLNSEIMEIGKQILQRAKGYYKFKAINSFNPLYWIEFIIFLPKNIMKYFGVDENVKIGSYIIKITQLLYWIASIIFMYIKYIKNE